MASSRLRTRMQRVQERLFGDASPEWDEIRVEQILLIAKGTPVMAVANLVNSALTAYLLHGHLPDPALYGWLGLVWIAGIWRLRSWLRNRHRPRPARFRLRVVRRAVIWAAMAGILWGAAAVVVARFGTITDQVFIAFVIGGQAAVAATWLAALPAAFWSYGLLSLAPMLVCFAAHGETIDRVMAIIITFGAGALVIFARHAYANFLAGVRGRLERERLLAELEQTQGELEARVRERTAELSETNRKLSAEVGERVRAEQDLRQSEQKFRNVIESSIQGILVHRDQKALFCNRAFCELFGYADTAGILALPDILVLLAPEGQARMKAQGEAPLRGEPAPQSYQVRGLPRNGEPIWLRVSSTLVEWEGERATQSVMIDVTESMALESRLRHSQKIAAIGQLAGGVAHDFNNLLQAIQGYTAMALEQVADEQPVREDLELVLEASRKGARLTSQLLAFGRQETLASATLDLNELVAKQLQLLERLIGEAIELRFSGAGQPLWVTVDAGLIEQALMNLVVNARDAMPAGGHIAIELSRFDADRAFCENRENVRPGPYASLIVRDEGTGIAPEVLERIFEPFFTTKKTGAGTGLGLSMVYGIVRQHSGAIEVDSQPSQGAVFQILLPLAAEPAEIPEQPVPQDVARSTRGHETVLVAEDDSMARRLAVRLLEQEGYRVVPASDGQEALELLERMGESIDLLLLDVIMPRAGGRVVYERAQSLLPDVGAIFCTGYSAEEVDAEFALDHNLRLVRKPFAKEELLATVREVLDRRR